MEDRETQIQAVVRRFFTLQEERSLTYSVFNEAHKIYLASPDEKAFRKFEKIVGDLTQDFKRISLDIIKIEKDLKEKFDESLLSTLIREIQNYEKNKLTLTAQLQIKKKEQKDSPCDEIEDTIANLTQSLNETVDGINQVLETMKFEIDA